MQYALEKINNDNRRPEMPEEGWLVRYDLSDYSGWLCTKVCETKEEAEFFALGLVEAASD
jgi:hypothetical protein